MQKQEQRTLPPSVLLDQTPMRRRPGSRHSVQLGFEGNRVETARLALCLRPLTTLDQEQEPTASGGEARSRRGLGPRAKNPAQAKALATLKISNRVRPAVHGRRFSVPTF
jgi:hypothetical protein